jgi:hypothetical protein
VNGLTRYVDALGNLGEGQPLLAQVEHLTLAFQGRQGTFLIRTGHEGMSFQSPFFRFLGALAGSPEGGYLFSNSMRESLITDRCAKKVELLSRYSVGK